MSEDIEFSKEGIKISYIRFLADAGAGFLIVLIFTYAYLIRTPTQTLEGIPDGIWILISILLVLLSIPLGVITNGASYFLLGWMQEFLVQLCIEESILSLAIRGLAGFTKRKYDYEMIIEKFGIKKEKKKFYQISQYFETLLSVKYPDVSKQFGYIIRCSRLSRNFALLDIGVFGYLITANQPVGLPLLISLIFLIMPLTIVFVIKILYFNKEKLEETKYYKKVLEKTKPYITKLEELEFYKNHEKIIKSISVILIVCIILCFIISFLCFIILFLYFITFKHLPSLTIEGTFLLNLLYCQLIFAFFIGISSLLEFYYFINILHATRVLSEISKEETLKNHIFRFKQELKLI